MNKKEERCPKCNANLTGEEIPDELKEHYAGTHWSKKIIIAPYIGADSVAFQCPYCKHQWKKEN
ncbi:hypothetical protein [Aneurinibacillus terranovensis]|uniref:hypothetical protein n=1 Tax=Aneurinibacillus terranovensis TaxID=278991 RepID=UPI000404554F|nr:hypothetical protein [Aneurinibacillus terranovensis]